MRIRPTLLFWLFRQTWPVTAVGVVLACLWLVFERGGMYLSMFFVPAHSLAVAACLGRFRSGNFAFLYGRGHNRDVLWFHTMLASVLAVLAVLLPAALTLWLPIRSVVQDVFFDNPDYPVAMLRDAWRPWGWLGTYAFMLPTFHYAWIRQAFPCRYSDDGLWLAAAVVIGGAVFPDLRREFWYVSWSAPLVWIFRVSVPLLLLAAGWRLHRRMEAHS